MQRNYQDHYQTLGLAPGATAEQIKKAWRKKILDLHPDKTGNDPALALRFAAVQQAYEVLSDPLQKIEFLQERWLRKAQGQSTATHTIDLAGWIKECLALEKKVSTQDPDRIDHRSVQEQIEKLTAEQTITSLQSFAHPEAMLTGARLLLQAATLLPLTRFIPLVYSLAKIEPQNSLWQQELTKAKRKISREASRDRYRVMALVLLTVLLCLLIAS